MPSQIRSRVSHPYQRQNVILCPSLGCTAKLGRVKDAKTHLMGHPEWQHGDRWRDCFRHCDYCDFFTIQLSNLKGHVERKHPLEYPTMFPQLLRAPPAIALNHHINRPPSIPVLNDAQQIPPPPFSLSPSQRDQLILTNPPDLTVPYLATTASMMNYARPLYLFPPMNTHYPTSFAPYPVQADISSRSIDVWDRDELGFMNYYEPSIHLDGHSLSDNTTHGFPLTPFAAISHRTGATTSFIWLQNPCTLLPPPPSLPHPMESGDDVLQMASESLQVGYPIGDLSPNVEDDTSDFEGYEGTDL